MKNDYGYEIYKDVVIYWDEDHDERIKLFVDDLTDSERDNLIICHESKGDLTLYWYEAIPESFQDKKEVKVSGIDNWNIQNFHWVGR